VRRGNISSRTLYLSYLPPCWGFGALWRVRVQVEEGLGAVFTECNSKSSERVVRNMPLNVSRQMELNMGSKFFCGAEQFCARFDRARASHFLHQQ
jgi:hypothetical protein